MMRFKKLFYSNIFVYTLLVTFIFPGICYSRTNLLRVPIGDYTRIEEHINTTILNQRAFPSSLLREILSETGLKIYFFDKENNKVSIDLSLPGINDGIEIRFVERNELNNQPFTKTESDNKITYTISKDITLNEVRYLLGDMDSILKKYKNRLMISNTFSLRLRHLALYLAKNINFEELGEKSDSLKKRIEDLYLLGVTIDRENILKPDKKINPVNFEEIKSKRCLYETALLDYMKDNNLLLDLASKNTEVFIEKILKIMKKEVILAMRTSFSGAIFAKGAERLFSELKKRYKITERLINYLKVLHKTPNSELLKDTLPIEDWKNRLKNATETEEVEIVKEIVKIVDKYPGWKDKRSIDYIIKYVLSKKELNCLTRSILLARILKEIGVKEERVCYAAFPWHAFLIMKLKSGNYLNIESKDTRLLKDTIAKELDRAFEKVKLLGSVRVELKEPLWPFRPETMVITISNVTEGLLAGSDIILGVDIGAYINENPNLTREEKIKIFNMALILLEEAERLDKNDPTVYNNQGFTLFELAMIEKDKNPEKAIALLNKAIEKAERVFEINPEFITAGKNLELFNGEKILLEESLRQRCLESCL